MAARQIVIDEAGRRHGPMTASQLDRFYDSHAFLQLRVIPCGGPDNALADLIDRIDSGIEFPDASAAVAIAHDVDITELTAAYDVASQLDATPAVDRSGWGRS